MQLDHEATNKHSSEGQSIHHFAPTKALQSYTYSSRCTCNRRELAAELHDFVHSIVVVMKVLRRRPQAQTAVPAIRGPNNGTLCPLSRIWKPTSQMLLSFLAKVLCSGRTLMTSGDALMMSAHIGVCTELLRRQHLP